MYVWRLLCKASDHDGNGAAIATETFLACSCIECSAVLLQCSAVLLETY